MPAILLWLGAALSSLFASRIGQWVASAMVFLGLSFAVSKFAVGPILGQIQAVASGLAGDALGWLAFFNVDKYVTIILSAYAVGAGKSVLLRKRGG